MVSGYLADVAGEFPFVNHGFGHGQKDAPGFLLVAPWLPRRGSPRHVTTTLRRESRR